MHSSAFEDENSYPSRRELRALLDAQQYRCAMTGEPLDPDDVELDHVCPQVNGRNHSIENLQWVCREVNRAKGTMSNEEFIAMCVRVAMHRGNFE